MAMVGRVASEFDQCQGQGRVGIKILTAWKLFFSSFKGDFKPGTSLRITPTSAGYVSAVIRENTVPRVPRWSPGFSMVHVCVFGVIVISLTSCKMRFR